MKIKFNIKKKFYFLKNIIISNNITFIFLFFRSKLFFFNYTNPQNYFLFHYNNSYLFKFLKKFLKNYQHFLEFN